MLLAPRCIKGKEMEAIFISPEEETVLAQAFGIVAMMPLRMPSFHFRVSDGGPNSAP